MELSKGKGIPGKYKFKSGFSGTHRDYQEFVPKTEPPSRKKPETITPKNPPKTVPIRQNETEAEKAERIHRTFEKLLTFVEIVGQVDNYVSTKWKNIVKTVSNLYEEEDHNYHLGLKKFKDCPAFLNET